MGQKLGKLKKNLSFRHRSGNKLSKTRSRDLQSEFIDRNANFIQPNFNTTTTNLNTQSVSHKKDGICRTRSDFLQNHINETLESNRNVLAQKKTSQFEGHKFLQACENGDVRTVMQMIDTPAINYRNYQGSTALHMAASGYDKTRSKPFLEIIRGLLDRGVDINLPDHKNRTVLMECIISEKFNLLVCLLERKSDVNLKDTEGNTAVHHAMKGNHVEVIKLLRCYNADFTIPNNNLDTPLHLAVQFYDATDSIKELLRSGAGVNVTNMNNATPATKCLSSTGGLCLSSFMSLLEHGGDNIDLNIVDKYGRTTLHYSYSKFLKTKLDVDMFKKGVNPNIKDFKQMTAFAHLETFTISGYKAKLIRNLQAGYHPCKRLQTILKMRQYEIFNDSGEQQTLARMLHILGFRFEVENIVQKMIDDNKSEEVIDFVIKLQTNPLSLQDISGVVIRSTLLNCRPNVLVMVKKLPIPKPLQKFVTLGEFPAA